MYNFSAESSENVMVRGCGKAFKLMFLYDLYHFG